MPLIRHRRIRRRYDHPRSLVIAIYCFSSHYLLAQVPGDSPQSVSVNGIPSDLPTASEIIQKQLGETEEQQKLYRKACNSVVKVETSDSLGMTVASGFFIDEEGIVATIVSTNRIPENISVHWLEERYPAKLLAIDPRTRLALLKIKATMTPALKSSPSLDMPVGSHLFAISDHSNAIKRLAAGRLAGRESTLKQHVLPTTILRLNIDADADAFGAPVLDSNGNVSAILLRDLDETNEVCFALPSEILQKVLRDYQSFQRVEPAWCGFTLELGTSTPRVVIVQKDSPAEKAGFQSGDVILSIGGRSIRGYQDVVDNCYYLTAGEETIFQVLRGQDDVVLKLTPVTVSREDLSEK